MFSDSLYISSHFDIMQNACIVEFSIRGMYVALYFNKAHQVVNRDIWYLQ